MQSPLVPTSKDDQEAIKRLQAASTAQVLAVADELLEWLQDGNWTVSGPIADVLAMHVDALTHKLVLILQGYDSGWKYVCIHYLLMNLTKAQIPPLILDELQRLTLQPTENDVAEGAAEIAGQLLAGDY
jgi:hypothetical protein